MNQIGTSRKTKNPSILIPIGEMAKLCCTTTKTLKHYEKMELLLPAKVCEETGYRYYTETQINLFNAIHGLRLNHFSLQEIKDFIDNPGPEKLTHIYDEKIHAVNQEIAQLEETKKRLEIRKSYIDQALYLKENRSFQETNFRIKPFPSRCILTSECRGNITHRDIGIAFAKNLTFSQQHQLKIYEHLMLFYSPFQDINKPDFHYEIANIIECEEPFSSSRIKLLPEGDYVCFYHDGPIKNIAPSLMALNEWKINNNIETEGPLITLFLISYAHTLEFHQSFVEFQYKIKKGI